MVAFYAVDCQKDFIDSDGALAVKGAEEIRENIAKLIDLADKKDAIMMASVDEHPEVDPEFDIFPPHCVNGTDGQKMIEEATYMEEYQRFIANSGSLPDNLPVNAQIIFEKQTYDVWKPREEGGNPNLKHALANFGVKSVIVFGVATNICVEAAVNGFIDNEIKVFLVEDAIKGINIDEENNEEKAIERMVDKGAVLVETETITDLVDF